MMTEDLAASRRRCAIREQSLRILTFALLIALVAATCLACRPRSRQTSRDRSGDTTDTPPAVVPPSPPNPPSPPTRSSPPPTGSRSFSTSTKFVVPSGVTTLRIEITAGGGGGGASCTSHRPGGSGVGHREVGSFAVTPGDILDVSVTPPERGRCGGGSGGRGGSASIRGRGVNIFADGGRGGIGTGGGCSFCGGDGGPSSAFVSW